MNVTAIISCVVPSDLQYIRDALVSVKEQTHPCRILLVVTEETNLLEPIAEDLGIDLEAHIVSLSPAGVTKNLGVQKVATEWVAFLDADDRWKSEKIERQLAHASRTNSSAVGTRHLLIREDGTPFFYAFARKMPMPSSWLVKRNLMLTEPFSDLAQWEDAELWKRLRQQSKAVTMRDFLLDYRVRPNSLSSAYGPAKRRKEKFARFAEMNKIRIFSLMISRLVSIFISTDI